MAVNNSIPVVEYTGNELTTEFSFNFKILVENDLVVLVNGVVKTRDVDYQIINLTSGSGTVQFFEAPLTGEFIRLERRISKDRATDYLEGGGLASQTLDDDLDRVVMMIQEQNFSSLTKTPGTDNYDAVNNNIINLAEPINPQDAATKNYGDTNWGGQAALNAAASEINAANSAAAAAASNVAAAAEVVNAQNEVINAQNEVVNAQNEVINAQNEVINAQNEVAKAAEWANKSENVLISVDAGGDQVDDYSALHWARKSQQFATSTNINTIQAGDSHKTLRVKSDESGFEIIDAGTQRTNLDVYSKAEVDVIHNKQVTHMTKSGSNGHLIIVNGKLYSTHGTNAFYFYDASGRYGNGAGYAYGCDNFKEIIIPSSSPIVKADMCGNNAYALLENGELYTWGKNANGQCGLGHNSPVILPTLASTNVVDVYTHPSNGDYSVSHTRLFIKKTDGYLYCAGYNGLGALGLGNTTDRNTFVQITSLGNNILNVFNLGSTYGCTVVQKTDHTIWVAGYNAYGNLGLGNTTNQTSFVNVTGAWGGGAGYVLKHATGGFRYYDTALKPGCHLHMLLDNGMTTIYRTAGYNEWGTIGNGTVTATNITTPVAPNVGSGRIAEIAVFGGGPGTVNLKKENNELWVWGFNGRGQLGNGTTVSNGTPTLRFSDCIKLFSDGQTSHSHSYYSQSFIKRTDNQLYGCGHNSGVYLGFGDAAANVTSYNRCRLPYDFDIQDLGHYTTHNYGRILLAVGPNDKIYVWGYNAHHGVFYAGSTDNVTVPTQIEITEDNK